MIRFYGEFETYFSEYATEIIEKLDISDHFIDNPLSIVRYKTSRKVPFHGSMNVVSNPFYVTFYTRDGDQDFVSFHEGSIVVLLSPCGSPRHDVFLLAHELRHVQQFLNKRVRNDHSWDGKNFRHLMESARSTLEYMSLPWEADANEFALSFVNEKNLPAGVDFQSPSELYRKYRKYYPLLRFIHGT